MNVKIITSELIIFWRHSGKWVGRFFLSAGCFVLCFKYMWQVFIKYN